MSRDSLSMVAPFRTMSTREALMERRALLYEQDFPTTAGLDDQDEFVVDWRQALNGRKTGALFISVEGEARPEWTGPKRRFGAQAFVQLTDLGLAWKLTPDEAFLFGALPEAIASLACWIPKVAEEQATFISKPKPLMPRASWISTAMAG